MRSHYVCTRRPIVPPSLINKSSTRVTIPLDAIVIASVELAEPIVPPSLIKMSSTKVTIPDDAIVIAEVELAEPIVPPSEEIIFKCYNTCRISVITSATTIPIVPPSFISKSTVKVTFVEIRQLFQIRLVM